MPLSNDIKEKISFEVIKTLVTRFENFPEDASNNRNAPFHEAFLNAFSDKLKGNVTDVPFFISLSSWLHGLNTTLGQTFFENIAHHLSQGEKREYTSGKLGNLKITQTQRDHISKIIADLSNTTATPNLTNENEKILSDYNTALINALDFSADVFIEEETTITAVELKSVKPNSGEMRGEKQKILEGKAALYKKFPGKQIKFFIGFPFDPTVDPTTDSVTSHDKTKFLGSIINMTKFFDPAECLVADELWNLLSGQTDTMSSILEIINALSTPEFLTKLQFINDKDNRSQEKYRTTLTEWFLFSEIELLDNETEIIEKIKGKSTLIKSYNKNLFDSKGCYNLERYSNIIAELN